MNSGGTHWIALALLCAACSSTTTPSSTDAGSDVRVFDAGDHCGPASYQLATLLHPGVASGRETATVAQVVEAVAHTALLDAIVRAGTIESGVVLGYTRSTGGLVDETPEWIVVVNAAWAR